MTKFSEETVDGVLHYDAVKAAEAILGKSCDDFNEEEKDLNLSLQLKHVKAKHRVLESLDDVHFGTSLENYESIIKDIGFECLLVDDFMSVDIFDKKEYPEQCKIWFLEEKGIVLFYDTYRGKVNDSHFYYNWKPKRGNSFWEYASSGHIVKDTDIWSGNYDARQAVRTNINNLSQGGKFVVPWVEEPFLWFTNHAETKVEGYDYKAITKDREKRAGLLNGQRVKK